MASLIRNPMILLVGYFTFASCQMDCTGRADGAHGWGCRSFTVCQGGKGFHIDCLPPLEVFNPAKGACDVAENVPPPCGSQPDCEGRDGRFADHDLNCTSFFTCIKGVFYGHNPCAPGLVFDEVHQFCNWVQDVPPPCGTKVEQ